LVNGPVPVICLVSDAGTGRGQSIKGNPQAHIISEDTVRYGNPSGTRVILENVSLLDANGSIALLKIAVVL
jgi:hypothetical protein